MSGDYDKVLKYLAEVERLYFNEDRSKAIIRAIIRDVISMRDDNEPAGSSVLQGMDWL